MLQNHGKQFFISIWKLPKSCITQKSNTHCHRVCIHGGNQTPNVLEKCNYHHCWTFIYDVKEGYFVAIMLLLLFFIYFLSSPKDLFSLTLERGGKRERHRERHKRKREAQTGCMPYIPDPAITCPDWGLCTFAPGPGIKPATQACALTKNRTCNILVTGWCSNQQSHTGQGTEVLF